MHPATARHVARKLVEHFVSDPVDDSLVQTLVNVWLAQKGELVPVLRALFSSVQFASSIGAKTVRPFEHVIATARLLDMQPAKGNLDGPWNLAWRAIDAGHNPFGHPLPTGHPDNASSWTSAGVTLSRFNTSLALASDWGAKGMQRPPLADVLLPVPLSSTHGQLIDDLALRLFGSTMMSEHKQALLDFLGVSANTPLTVTSSAVTWKLPRLVALLLDSPYHCLR